ncbi:MAG: hypothetical protein ABFS09_03235 [Thermodesulfobacteriota bacterium]
MALALRVFIRTCVLLLYFMVFVGVYVGLHVYMAGPASVQDSKEYGAGNGPDYFPVLVVDRQEEGNETLVLRSLAKADYAGLTGAKERSWYLYRVQGEGLLTHADRVTFKVETLSEKLQQVVITIGEANGQRTSIYTYQIEGKKVSPRSHQLLASFGNNFSPMPFTMVITAIIVLLMEKFVVRRLLKPAA